MNFEIKRFDSPSELLAKYIIDWVRRPDLEESLRNGNRRYAEVGSSILSMMVDTVDPPISQKLKYVMAWIERTVPGCDTPEQLLASCVGRAVRCCVPPEEVRQTLQESGFWGEPFCSLVDNLTSEEINNKVALLRRSARTHLVDGDPSPKGFLPTLIKFFR